MALPVPAAGDEPLNPSSALYWLPRLEALQRRELDVGLPLLANLPRTVIVPYSHREAVNALEGEGQGGFPAAAMQAACRTIGYPVFLRTDLASAKHDGPQAYRADNWEQVADRYWRTVEDNEGKFWLEPAGGPTAFLVREWLDLDGTFHAFGGHLIARIRRIGSTSCSP